MPTLYLLSLCVCVLLSLFNWLQIYNGNSAVLHLMNSIPMDPNTHTIAHIHRSQSRIELKPPHIRNREILKCSKYFCGSKWCKPMSGQPIMVAIHFSDMCRNEIVQFGKHFLIAATTVAVTASGNERKRERERECERVKEPEGEREHERRHHLMCLKMPWLKIARERERY